MASSQADAFHDMVRAFRAAALGTDASAPPSIDEMRAGAEATMAMVGVMPDGVVETATSLADRDALQFDPAGGVHDRVVLFFHGGGYVMNSLRSHARLAGAIGHAAGCRVISFDYRMAPEHPFPAAVDDGLAAYRALLHLGYAPAQVAIAGDSAGGGLTLATLQAIRTAGLAQPAAAVVLSPWTDLEGTGMSMTSNTGRDLMIDGPAMTGVAAIYLAGADPRDPLAAPLYADYSGLAPIYIQVGGDEVLLDDSTRVAVSAAHAGVAVRLDVFPEMQHVFQSAVGMLPESDEAISRVGSYLKHALQLG